MMKKLIKKLFGKKEKVEITCPKCKGIGHVQGKSNYFGDFEDYYEGVTCPKCNGKKTILK